MPRKPATPKPPPIPPATIRRDASKLASLAAKPVRAAPQPTKGRRAAKP